MKFKKIVASILLASMALSMVACGDSSSSSNKGGTTATIELKDGGIYSCSDTPLELTAFVNYQGTYVLNDSMEIPKEMSNFTNIILKGAASEYSSNPNEAFNLLMTDLVLPDLVAGNYVDITKYGLQGAFTPLNDLIDEYAPNIQKAFELYPEAKATVTAENGNIYCIPFIYTENISEIWWIRQDWLDAVDMEMPTTLAEYEAVLTAFANEDPNGNGAKDEVAFFMRKSNADHSLRPLMALYGVNDNWHIAEDGTVQIGSYTDAFKDAMKGISSWYKQGLLDPEILTPDSYVRETLFPANNGGSTHDWIPSTSAYNESMQEYVDGFNLVGMLPPADVNGNVWEAYSRARIPGDAWGISADNEHPVESIKFMDWLFSDKGREVTTYGILGDTYEYGDDGLPYYTDKIMNSDQAVNLQIFQMGGMIPRMAFLHVYRYEELMMSEEGQRSYNIYKDAEVVGSLNANAPALSFTDEENKILTSTWVQCRSYTLEKINSWTYNGDKIDAEFDDYIAALKKMGMDDVVKVYNDAYARYLETAK